MPQKRDMKMRLHGQDEGGTCCDVGGSQHWQAALAASRHSAGRRPRALARPLHPHPAHSREDELVGHPWPQKLAGPVVLGGAVLEQRAQRPPEGGHRLALHRQVGPGGLVCGAGWARVCACVSVMRLLLLSVDGWGGVGGWVGAAGLKAAPTARGTRINSALTSCCRESAATSGALPSLGATTAGTVLLTGVASVSTPGCAISQLSTLSASSLPARRPWPAAALPPPRVQAPMVAAPSGPRRQRPRSALTQVGGRGQLALLTGPHRMARKEAEGGLTQVGGSGQLALDLGVCSRLELALFVGSSKVGGAALPVGLQAGKGSGSERQGSRAAAKSAARPCRSVCRQGMAWAVSGRAAGRGWGTACHPSCGRPREQAPLRCEPRRPAWLGAAYVRAEVNQGGAAAALQGKGF